MANVTIGAPGTSDTGTQPTATRTSTLVVYDGTNTGCDTIASVLGLVQQSDMAGTFAPSGSNVNYLGITPGTTGNGVTIVSNGTDTDIDITLTPKGGGAVNLGNAGSVVLNTYTYANSGIACHGLNVNGNSSTMWLFIDTDHSLIFQSANYDYQMRFDQTGNLQLYNGGLSMPNGTITAGAGVFGTGAAEATSATTGHLMIPFCAGTPTGVPANASTGVSLRYDTTAHKLWAYDNGTNTWKGVALT